VLRFVARTLLVLVLVEGAASLVVVGGRALLLAQRPLAERAHTQYDPEIGWVARPDLRLPDLYGPGVGLSTDARGFRGGRATAEAIPPGRLRVVCSGDSFTLGYGVDDAHTFCARLESLEPRFETVNLGQGGYGVDQSYLWYRRHAPALAHSLHLVAFIHEDFARMREASFLGYGKPVLRLREGRLAVENVPVPRAAFRLPWLAQNARLLTDLRSVTLARAALRRFAAPEPSGPADTDLPALALAVFESLRELAAERGAALVLVYLPTREDREAGPADAWRAELARALAERGFDLLDLIPEFRELPREIHETLFIPAGRIGHPYAAGHYTEAGNAQVAGLLHERLRALPEVARRLRSAGG
jgi:hypothetical protein